MTGHMTHQEADRLRTIGSGIALAGFVSTMVVFMAWLKFGEWSMVLTWGMAAAVYLLLAGFTLAADADKAARYSDPDPEVDE